MKKGKRAKVLVVLHCEYADVIDAQTIRVRNSEIQFRHTMAAGVLQRLIAAYPFLLVRVPDMVVGGKYTVPRGGAWCNNGTGDEIYISLAQALWDLERA